MINAFWRFRLCRSLAGDVDEAGLPLPGIVCCGTYWRARRGTGQRPPA